MIVDLLTFIIPKILFNGNFNAKNINSFVTFPPLRIDSNGFLNYTKTVDYLPQKN